MPSEFFAIIALEPHQKPPPGYRCVAHGGDHVWEHLKDSVAQRALVKRAEEARRVLAAQARADRASAVEIPALVQEACNRLAKAEARMVRLEAMNAALEAKIVQYEQQAKLDALPDPDNPETYPPALRSSGDLGPVPVPGHDREAPAATRDADSDPDLEDIAPDVIDPFGASGTDPVTPAELSHPYVPKYRTPAAVSLGAAGSALPKL